jgi:hypothetical protein
VSGGRSCAEFSGWWGLSTNLSLIGLNCGTSVRNTLQCLNSFFRPLRFSFCNLDFCWFRIFIFDFFSKYEINKYACPVWLQLVLERCRLKCAYICVEFFLLLAACSALASGELKYFWFGCGYLVGMCISANRNHCRVFPQKLCVVTSCIQTTFPLLVVLPSPATPAR